MKTYVIVALATFAISGSFLAHAGAADQHEDHRAHGAPEAAPALAEGELWPTDAPLRTAMQKIRTAVESVAQPHQQKRLSAEEGRTLAKVVEQQVAYMVANCRLPPDADAALHVLIGRMMGAAESLKSDPPGGDAVPQLEAVLEEYHATFDHPGW